MNDETIAALERAAELIVNGGIRCQQDAALIRAHIETLRAGGERRKPSSFRCSVCKGMTSPIYGCACNNWDENQ